MEQKILEFVSKAQSPVALDDVVRFALLENESPPCESKKPRFSEEMAEQGSTRVGLAEQSSASSDIAHSYYVVDAKEQAACAEASVARSSNSFVGTGCGGSETKRPREEHEQGASNETGCGGNETKRPREEYEQGASKEVRQIVLRLIKAGKVLGFEKQCYDALQKNRSENGASESQGANYESLLQELQERSKQNEARLNILQSAKDQRDLVKKKNIDALHLYNDLKDTGQLLLGKIAEIEQRTTKSLYERFSIDIDD